MAALETGWSPSNLDPEATIREHLQQIATDPAAFLAGLDDPDGQGGPITLLDGSVVPRLPNVSRWIWHGEFCGRVSFRWQAGTSALPEFVLGHIGYAVVSWKRGRGIARGALALILPEARRRGLDLVELTSDSENLASHETCARVLELARPAVIR